MILRPQFSEQPRPGMPKLEQVGTQASLDRSSSSGDFGELLHWCDSFSETLHDVIDQIHRDMATSKIAAGQGDMECSGALQASGELQPISDVIDQIYDIVLHLERITQRAAR